MFTKISNFIERISEWFLWRSIKKKLRPFVKVRKVLQPNEVPSYMHLILRSLQNREYSGIILLSNNKRIYNYIKRTLGDTNTVFFREPFTFDPDKLFAKIKENANPLHVDYAVTGYENDSPFYILAVPNDRLNQDRRDCHKKPLNKRTKNHNKHNKE
ncbi:hypothetical protein [Fibrobacter sp.]|uniref:hypothetical protein n=1 Tax=Fibrobacter sp. TaxID=35828 RepID=UPI00386D64AC